jgi:hypothetical protein
MYLVNRSMGVLVHNMLLWLVHLCIWYSNNMIAPCYPESVANEVLSTVGGVRFIKWAQDLVSFVKCEPPSHQFSTVVGTSVIVPLRIS